MTLFGQPTVTSVSIVLWFISVQELTVAVRSLPQLFETGFTKLRLLARSANFAHPIISLSIAFLGTSLFADVLEDSASQSQSVLPISARITSFRTCLDCDKARDLTQDSRLKTWLNRGKTVLKSTYWSMASSVPRGSIRWLPREMEMKSHLLPLVSGTK